MHEQMINGSMMGTTIMMICVIGSALLALIFLVLIIIQTVLQAKILREVRKLTAQPPPAETPGGSVPAGR